jgi:hypothetical protein
MNNHEFIEEIEFFTSYPNKEGSRTILAVALTSENHKVLCYIPTASLINLSLEEAEVSDWDIKYIPIKSLPQQKKLFIGGQIYANSDSTHNGGKWFIKVIPLDGPINPIEVNKDDIEKLFGCKING